MSLIQLLAAVPREKAARYYSALNANSQLQLTLVSDSGDALAMLEDRSRHCDAFVLDAELANADALLDDILYRLPRLMLILVDESDQSPLREHVRSNRVSTNPFVDDELERRVVRLLSDSSLETVPANTMLPVRELARKLRAEDSPGDRFRVAVEACQGLGYRYTAFYRVEQQEPLYLKLVAQQGEGDMHLLVPLSATGSDAIARVAATGQSTILDNANAGDYLPVSAGALGVVALVAAGRAVCFGVLVAGRDTGETIDSHNVTVLELVAAQLAAALSRELDA